MKLLCGDRYRQVGSTKEWRVTAVGEGTVRLQKVAPGPGVEIEERTVWLEDLERDWERVNR